MFHCDFHAVSMMYRLFRDGTVVLTCYSISDILRYLKRNGIRDCVR